MMTEPQAAETFTASITVTARANGDGLLISMSVDGDLSDEMMSSRFYSVPELPPPSLDAAEFWSAVLYQIIWFLNFPS